MSETKRTADIFAAARSIYNRRKAFREKSIEEEEASQPIDVTPSSPDTSPG